MNEINHIKVEDEKDDGFCIKVYSPGNFIAKTITFNGPVNIGGSTETGGYTDEQIKKALTACVGKGKVIDRKHKWTGAYWLLRYACNYPVDPQKFCDKIDSLGMNVSPIYTCSYESIRKLCNLSFIDYDPRRMDEVKVSRNDLEAFSEYREIALKLAEELGKAYLPRP